MVAKLTLWVGTKLKELEDEEKNVIESNFLLLKGFAMKILQQVGSTPIGKVRESEVNLKKTTYITIEKEVKQFLLRAK